MVSKVKKTDSEQRKSDHLDLAKKSQTSSDLVESTYYYEPLFFSHPVYPYKIPVQFLGTHYDYPFWISSMTGGTLEAKSINTNLAKLCEKYHLGFGLGSCRSLLESDERMSDFKMRAFLGDRPFYANLGYAQIENLFLSGELSKITELVKKLEADGLIIHLNPLQEWFQPGGDRYKKSPIDVLPYLFDELSCPMMIKEVGHGFGPKTLKALIDLPFKAIEFGAFGGTNFSILESQRGEVSEFKKPFAYLGHSAFEMIDIINQLKPSDKSFIISGGMSSPLEAQRAYQLLASPKLIGLAYGFLAPAREGFESLETYFLNYAESFVVAKDLLVLKGK